MMEIVLLLISGAWAIVAYCNYKLYRLYKKCTIETEGVLSDLTITGGTKTRRLIGRLSFQTLKGKRFHVNYEKGKFEKVPKHKGFFLPEELPVTIMYDPEMPGVYHYIKGSYFGLQSIIIPATICAVFISLAVWSFFLLRF